MKIELLEIILLSIVGFISVYDDYNTKIGFCKPVVCGLLTGLIMGDIKTGLAIGGTMELMILGGGGYGGSSIPDYTAATIITSAFAIASGQGLEFALALAIPVGLLLLQLDIFVKFVNVFLLHKAKAAVEKNQFQKVALFNDAGMFVWGFSRAVPIFLCLYFGSEFVSSLVELFPQSVMSGLSVAAGFLPALGIAILLKYLPIKNYMAYAIIGFAFATYLNIPMMGVALIGVGLALLKYNSLDSKQMVTGNGADENE